jgi:hypothetical protein
MCVVLSPTSEVVVSHGFSVQTFGDDRMRFLQPGWRCAKKKFSDVPAILYAFDLRWLIIYMCTIIKPFKYKRLSNPRGVE